MEDVWRGEAQDLLTQIAQLQEENKSLLTNMSIKDPMSEEDLQRHEGEDVCSKHSQSRVYNFRLSYSVMNPLWVIQEISVTFTNRLLQGHLYWCFKKHSVILTGSLTTKKYLIFWEMCFRPATNS